MRRSAAALLALALAGMALSAARNTAARIQSHEARTEADSRVRALLTDMLPEAHFGAFALFAVVYSIATIVGLGLCIVPGLLVFFFLQLGPYYILDKGLSVGDAFKASYAAVSRNIGPALIMTIINVLVQILGGLFYEIGRAHV